MLRWCLSTVRVLGGGHDSIPRLSYCFNQTSWSSHAYTGAAVSIVEIPFTLAAPSSSAQPQPASSRDALSLSFGSSAGALEDSRIAKTACSRPGHSAIDTLRRFLSSENISSDRPLAYSPTTIRSLYYCAEAKNQLGMLDVKMLTLLIGLFGSLSTDPRIPVVYKVPQVHLLLRITTHRTYWTFVLKVGKYKLERGIPLQDSDRFWLMCAELAMVQAKPSERHVHNAILRARTHYHIIRRHSRRPEVHAYFLETLLAIRNPSLLDFAACDISFLIRTHRVYHSRLQHLLYRLVIQHESLLSTRSREAILAALWSRASREIDEASDRLPESQLSNITLNGSVVDATTMARSLSATLFGFASHLPVDKSTNSLHHLLSVFSPAYALPLRWSSLILLSVFNSHAMLHFDGIHGPGDHAIPQATSCWQIIFSLATAEKTSQELSSALAAPISAKRVLETTRNLYQLWLMITRSYPVSQDLACAITSSFLKMASVLADAALFSGCQGLHRPEDSLEGPRTLVQKHFVAQYIAAAVRVQGPLPDVVLTALKAFSADLRQQHEVLASAAEALVPIDASLAYTLYTVMKGKEMGSDLGAPHILAMSFAQRGALRQALLLNDGRFSLEKRGILVSAIARSLRENPRIRHPQNVFVAITRELAALYHSHAPPEHFRGCLEQLLVVLARHGRGTQLSPVVLSIFGRLPSFFQPRFFVRYCRVLLRHGQFTATRKIIDTVKAEHHKIARSLGILMNRTAIQIKIFQPKRTAPLRGPTSLRPSSRLRCCPYAAYALERSLQELLKSGQLLSAKHTFACAAATIPPARCTALGNILLHGVSHQPALRNGRRVRQVLALLENLVENHGFRPDRVTANILIRAMMKWRSAFDSPRLRELFDQLVRGGYPAADCSPLDPPFGTQRMRSSGSSGLSKLSSFVSFEKHGRPLFKMFIKAFYLCNDVEAARRVVEILRVEEHKNAMAKEARRKARTRGRIKATQKRDVTSQGATAS